MPLPRTYVATPKDIEKKWILVDAEDVVLGRLASVLAMRPVSYTHLTLPTIE